MIRAIGIVLAVGLLCLVGAVVGAQETVTAPQHGAPGEIEPSAADAVYPPSPERQALLARYSGFVNIWRFASFGITLGLLALILFTGLSARLARWARVGRKSYLVTLIYVALFFGVYYLLNLPFSYYREFLVESEYGFMNQTAGAWLLDDLKYLGIMILLSSIVVWILYRLLARMERWWLAFTLIAIPLIVLFAVIIPVYVSPLFNSYTPLASDELRTQIEQLADEAGVHGSAIYQVDQSRRSNKVNAYVTGVFGTKRIVLYDTMINNFEPEEIRFVMGHELGHYVMNHVWYGIILSVLFVGAALWLTDKTIRRVIKRFRDRFGFDRLDDLASLPLLMVYLSVITFLGGPIINGYSRLMEHQADIYGMEISGVAAEPAVRAFEKLSAYNLSDPDPHPFIEFWFYSHPSLNSRIAFVRSFQVGQNRTMQGG